MNAFEARKLTTLVSFSFAENKYTADTVDELRTAIRANVYKGLYELKYTFMKSESNVSFWTYIKWVKVRRVSQSRSTTEL